MSLTAKNICFALVCCTIAVFAPTDDAFDHATPALITYIESDPDNLERFLLYHVLGEEVLSNDISNGMTSPTLQGEDVKFNVVNLYWSWVHWVWVKRIFVNYAQVIQEDIDASNGVIHAINCVLVPSSFPKDIVVTAAEEGLTTFVWAVKAAGLEDFLKGNQLFTVFAPNNAAFDALGGLLNYLLATDKLEDILRYHIIPDMAITADMVQVTPSTLDTALAGSSLTAELVSGDIVINMGLMEEATVVKEDVEVLNGIIHVIDGVLLPSDFDLPPSTLIELFMDPSLNLSRLKDALDESGLSGDLEGEGPFTIFAPDNGAFDQEDLSGLSDDELVRLLRSHVIQGVYWTSDFITRRAPFNVRTLNGNLLSVAVDNNGDVIVGGSSKVVMPDNFAQNGVAHVIDRVLKQPCPYHHFFWCWCYGYR